MSPKKPREPVVKHPGVLLAEELDYRGISKSGFARAVGLSRPMIQQLCNGSRTVTLKVAVRLAWYFGISPIGFIIQQLAHDLSQEAAYDATFEVESVLRRDLTYSSFGPIPAVPLKQQLEAARGEDKPRPSSLWTEAEHADLSLRLRLEKFKKATRNALVCLQEASSAVDESEMDSTSGWMKFGVGSDPVDGARHRSAVSKEPSEIEKIRAQSEMVRQQTAAELLVKKIGES